MAASEGVWCIYFSTVKILTNWNILVKHKLDFKMSIKNDIWITEQSTGPRINYYYKNELVHKNITVDFLRFPDLIVSAINLKPGQSFIVPEDPDTRIEKVTNGDMITPFVGKSMKMIERGDGKWVNSPSYGLSSYGYDIRIGRNFKVMNGYRSTAHHVIDPTEPENMDGFFKDVLDADALEIAPHSFVLGVAMERLVLPNNVTGICMPKSSLARCGLVAHITPAEAGWSGYLTIELTNETDHPIRIHAGMGIMQLIFLEGEPCDKAYNDRSGKYHDQPALPVVAR